MSAKNKSLTLYESWNIREILIPSRSRLFSLEPIGIGTPYVESLSSYVTRLAEAHCVSLGILLTKEIKYVLSKTYKSRDLFCLKDRTGTVNGIGKIAKDLVQALEKLTLRNDLKFLTLLRWSKVLPQRGLNNSVKAWCPACYQVAMEEHQTIYEPLLWSLNDVRICPHHKIYLETICPHCQQKLLTLTSNSRCGYCHNCGQWLGRNLPQNISLVNSRENQWLFWIVDNLAKILAYTPYLPELSEDTVAQSLQFCIEQTGEENIASFARLIECPKNKVWMWANGKVLPQLLSLLKISYQLKYPLLDFLIRENFCDLKREKEDFEVIEKSTTGKIKDFSSIENLLKSILVESENEPPSLTRVAEKLGCHRRSLTRRFPELCSAISAKYLEYRKSKSLQRIQQYISQIQKAVIELDKKGIYPSESNVSKFVGTPGYFRYQEVRSALKKARDDLGIR